MRTLLLTAGLLLLVYTATAQQPIVTVQHLRPDTTGNVVFYPQTLAPAPNGGIQLHYLDSRLWPNDSYLITDASGNVLVDNGDTLVDRHRHMGFTMKYLPETQELTQWIAGGVESPAYMGDIALRRWDIGTRQAKPSVITGNPTLIDGKVRTVAADGQGGYLVGADCKDTIYFPPTDTWYPVCTSTVVSHVNAQGNTTFSTKLNIAKWGVGYTYVHGLIALGKNRYFATMDTDYADNIESKSVREVLLAGLNAQGDTLFTKHIPGFPYGLQPSNGGAILVSVTVEHLDSVRTAAYPRLVKLDSLGNIEWEHICRENEAGFAMPEIFSEATPDGGILLGYTTRNPDNMYGNDLYVARYSATGTLIWSQPISIMGADGFDQLMLHPNGTVWVTGTHQTGMGVKYYSTILAKLTDPTLLSTDLAQSPLVAVWPNPVGESRTLHVQLTSTQATLELFDVQGRSLRTHTATTPETDLDMSGLSAGVYLLRVTDASGATTQRVVLPE